MSVDLQGTRVKAPTQRTENDNIESIDFTLRLRRAFDSRTVHESDVSLKAETHDATNRCDTSRRQVPSSALILRQVAAIRNLFGARNQFWKRGNVN